ncbi:MAG: tetratricopeptide repeat protein, partial [Myxococcota bacterium]
RAVTLGDIARILRSKGQVDEALDLHRQRLAINEQLGDMDGRAHALWNLGQLAVQTEDWKQAFHYFRTAYELNLELQRLEGIIFVGIDFGQLLAAAGDRPSGLAILERSHQGLLTLGQHEHAEQVAQIIAQVRSG